MDVASHTQDPKRLDKVYLKGIATSVWQCSFDSTSQWSEFIKHKPPWFRAKFSAARKGASNFWYMYEQDIALMAKLGTTSFRFTLEWARLQPAGPGTPFDPEAVQTYNKMLDCMAAHGIEPMVTLHQFVHPAWFEKLGGFEKEENLHHFETFCATAFSIWGRRVLLWVTLNEPMVLAFMGYIGGVWPPGKKARFTTAGVVMANTLKVHCNIFRKLKQMPGGQEARIGFCHQQVTFIPRHNLPHVRKLCKWMTLWFGTYSVLKFFKTGVFEWARPFHKEPLVLLRDEGIARGEKVLDWWGINFYSRPAVHWYIMIGPGIPKEPVSDERFRLSPQGIYDTIRDASVLDVPMYITEHGIADQKDTHRAWYIKASHAMVLKALADGYDVRGSFWWTLMDNIEWHTAFQFKFGLYEWKKEFVRQYADSGNRPPGGPKLRDGGRALQQVYHAWPNRLAELRAWAQQQTRDIIPSWAPQPPTRDAYERGGGGIAGLPTVHGADYAYQDKEATMKLTAASGTTPTLPGGGIKGRTWLCCFQMTRGPPSHAGPDIDGMAAPNAASAGADMAAVHRGSGMGATQNGTGMATALKDGGVAHGLAPAGAHTGHPVGNGVGGSLHGSAGTAHMVVPQQAEAVVLMQQQSAVNGK